MAVTHARIRCRGFKKNGQPCGKNTTDPTGYCHLHKGNPGSPKSQRVSLTKSTMADIYSTKNSEVFAGGVSDDTPRPWEGSKILSGSDFSRPEVEGRSAKNWQMPEVKAAARRYTAVGKHLKQIEGSMKNVNDLVNKRLAAKSGGVLTPGTYEFTERGQGRIKLDVLEQPGNFSAARAKKIFSPDTMPSGVALDDYMTQDVNTRKLPAELDREPYRKRSADSVTLTGDYSEGEGIEDKYADMYDSSKLEHWPTGRLVEEYQALEDIHNEYKDVQKKDGDYLKGALSEGKYADSDPFNGEVTMTVGSKAGSVRWDKKAVLQHFQGREDEMPTVNTFTAASVKAGDKRNGTDYYDQIRKANGRTVWGNISYV